MQEGSVVFVAIGLGLGLLMGARWVRMKNARSGWSSARAAVPKAKAARKAAFGGYLGHSRSALLMAVIVVVVFVVLYKAAQGG